LIPSEGSFKKDVTDITNIKKVELFNITISLDHLETESLEH